MAFIFQSSPSQKQKEQQETAASLRMLVSAR
jgi:hypothetical protein